PQPYTSPCQFFAARLSARIIDRGTVNRNVAVPPQASAGTASHRSSAAAGASNTYTGSVAATGNSRDFSGWPDPSRPRSRADGDNARPAESVTLTGGFPAPGRYSTHWSAANSDPPAVRSTRSRTTRYRFAGSFDFFGGSTVRSVTADTPTRSFPCCSVARVASTP